MPFTHINEENSAVSKREKFYLKPDWTAHFKVFITRKDGKYIVLLLCREKEPRPPQGFPEEFAKKAFLSF